jgi:hypothetical protein
MRIQDFDKIKAHVTFSKGIVRVFLESGRFLVKFFRGEEFIGDSILGKLEWTAFPNDNVLSDWKIEFWDDIGKSLVGVHYHFVHGSKVLIIPTPTKSNQIMVENVIEECKRAQSMGAKCSVFFEGAYRYKTKLEQEQIGVIMFGKNHREKFPFIIEKEF